MESSRHFKGLIFINSSIHVSAMLSNLAVGFARCGLDYESEYLCQGEDFKIRPVVYYTICEQHYCNGNQQPV